MALVEVQNITKSYGTNIILEEVSFRLEQGDKVGLIGNNGAGKTTLIEMIAGQLPPDRGEIVYSKNLTIGYLPQQIHLSSQNSIYEECKGVFAPLMALEKTLRQLEEEIATLQEEALESALERYGRLSEEFQERGGFEIESQVRGTLFGLGFSEGEFERTVDTLSGGQKSRLELGKLLLQKPNLLLLDEPTNHLDIDSILWLERFLQDSTLSLLLISHDRYFLDHVVNGIILLENQSLSAYRGDYTTYMKKRKKELEDRQALYLKQQKEIKRQEEIIKRYESWNRERSLKQARSRQKALDKMERVEIDPKGAKAKMRFEPKRESGKDVLLFQDVSKSYGVKKIFENVSFPVYKGERVGLIGPNGVGKSTLFKMIQERVTPDTGSIEIGTGVEISYFDQEMADLSPEKMVIEEVWDQYPDLREGELRTYLAQFLFPGEDIYKEVAELSGGEKGRLALLEVMLNRSNLLLLDEPTNHLDIDSKEILEDALNEYTGTILTISHDRYFLNRVATKIIALSHEGVFIVEGNYDYYREKVEELRVEEEALEEISRTEKDKQKKQSREDQRESRRRRADLRSMEERIKEVEERLTALDKILSDPSTYENHSYVLEIQREREVVQSTLDGYYEEWMDLMGE